MVEEVKPPSITDNVTLALFTRKDSDESLCSGCAKDETKTGEEYLGIVGPDEVMMFCSVCATALAEQLLSHLTRAMRGAVKSPFKFPLLKNDVIIHEV